MSNTLRILVALGFATVVAACAEQEEVIYVEGPWFEPVSNSTDPIGGRAVPPALILNSPQPLVGAA